MQDRSIIHLNVTDFAVAVERLQDSSLKRLPLIVAPHQAARALVYDMSEEAYGDGVRKGMRLDQARRYCRRARILRPRPRLYRKAMEILVAKVIHYTPLLEQGKEDGHLFMDVTGTHRLFGPAPDIAWRLRKQLLKEVGLDPAWSLASNKLVCKVASRVVRPLGEYIVGAGEETEFLAPLPLALLPGLTSQEIGLLRDFNLERIGQLAQLNREQLAVPFRRGRGDYLYAASRGEDNSPVFPGTVARGRICREYHFQEDSADPGELQGVLTTLVHEIGRQLRQEGKVGRRVGVRLTYSDGRESVRQATQAGGTDNDFFLRHLALTALNRAWRRRIRVRCCVLICDRLLPRSRQQTLFVLRSFRELQQEKMLTAMDAVCARFGSGSIRLGSAC